MVDEAKPAYSKFKLMQCTDIDPIAGEAQAGSRDAYFRRLDNFVKTVPTLLEGLKLPQTDTELKVFLRNAYALQELLDEIVSPTLPELARKTADGAKRGDRKRCGDALFSLTTKVKKLCADLLEAKGGGDTSVGLSPDGSGEAGAASGRRVIVASVAPPPVPDEFKPLETLCQAIDDIDIEGATEALRLLKESNLPPEIDADLGGIAVALRRFDYDAASDLGKRLLKTARGEPVPPLEKKKILAIDDMPVILNSIWTFLKAEYTVYCVTNQAGVHKCLSNHSIDLILLDIEMPGISGFDLMDVIQATPGHEKTPIIFLTGSSSAENVKQAMARGASDFITKPIDPETLRTRIQKHIG